MISVPHRICLLRCSVWALFLVFFFFFFFFFFFSFFLSFLLSSFLSPVLDGNRLLPITPVVADAVFWFRRNWTQPNQQGPLSVLQTDGTCYYSVSNYCAVVDLFQWKESVVLRSTKTNEPVLILAFLFFFFFFFPFFFFFFLFNELVF